mgnify:CR=1 FL=1
MDLLFEKKVGCEGTMIADDILLMLKVLGVLFTLYLLGGIYS